VHGARASRWISAIKLMALQVVRCCSCCYNLEVGLSVVVLFAVKPQLRPCARTWCYYISVVMPQFALVLECIVWGLV
jgi:hypothetical protein